MRDTIAWLMAGVSRNGTYKVECREYLPGSKLYTRYFKYFKLREDANRYIWNRVTEHRKQDNKYEIIEVFMDRELKE